MDKDKDKTILQTRQHIFFMTRYKSKQDQIRLKQAQNTSVWFLAGLHRRQALEIQTSLTHLLTYTFGQKSSILKLLL